MKMTIRMFFCSVLLFSAGTVFAAGQQQTPASTRNARYFESLTANLIQEVRRVQDDNAELSIQVAELQRKLREVTARNEEMAQEMQKMRRQFAVESEAREAQMREIAEQLRKLASAPPPPPPPPPVTKKESAPPRDSGRYEIFEVPRGGTLSAIASAFNVSVQDIMKANNLKNDRLAVGQKLKIPIK